MNSNKKGKRGELEFAKLLNDKLKTNYRRTPQSGGMDFKGDIITFGNSRARDFHWEVKRQEKLNLYKAYQQAQLDARDGKIPIVAFRRNQDNWKVCIDAEDFINLIMELDQLMER